MRCTGVTFAVAAVLLACDLPLVSPDQPLETFSRDEAAAFQTDSLRYTLLENGFGWEVHIGYTFTNPTDRAAYIINCNGETTLVLQKEDQDGWRNAWSPIVPACLSVPPIQIASGQSYTTVLYLFAGFPSNNIYPKFLPG